MDRLRREGNPPTGQLASPVPQYKDTVLNDWAELQGEGGASYVKDRDALAKLEQARVLLSGVATEAKLEEARALLESVAGKDFATQATLAQVKSELELVKAELATIKANQLSGDQKVQLSGTITELVLEQIGATYMIGQTLRLIAEGGDSMADGKTIDASKYKEWFIHIQNNHEKEITLQLSIRSHGGQIINNTAGLGIYPDTVIGVPAGASKVLTKDDIPQLGWAIPAFIFYCRSSSPAQGSMDVRIYGRRW